MPHPTCRGSLLLVTALLAVLTGCSEALPPGVDGNLGDDWPQPPSPVAFEPAAKGCFDKMEAVAPLAEYAPFDCAERHVAESYFVGDLPRSTGNSRDKAMRVAGTECSKRADAFTGGDWRTAALRLQPVLPGPAGWSAGARWYRCDLGQVEPGTDKVVSRSGSLKGALTGPAPLALRCFDPDVNGTNVRTMKAVPCADPHHAEFTGLWDAPEVDLDELDDDSRMAKGCRTSIADYTDVPDDNNLQYRAGWLAFAPSRGEWAAGIRAVQCFLWLADEPMRGSFKDAGNSKLPIHYA
ncbi:septum formation family protein [Actinoplanes sp. NPDC051470]|uniref:septum formation family protein n=1 Tax=unclassified Actinoplanes TaxID=2626549 RepID=UPI00343699E2